jgi:hypothetical protein
MREFIALLRECLSGAKVTFAGDYYQVRGFRLGAELGGCRSPARPAAGVTAVTATRRPHNSAFDGKCSGPAPALSAADACVAMYGCHA